MIKISDHITVALSKMLYQFQGKENWQKLLTALIGSTSSDTEALQAIEEKANELYDRLNFITGTNLYLLRRVGEIVGRDYNNIDMETFRKYVHAQIQSNKSRGTATEVMLIFVLLCFPDWYKFKEYFPGHVHFNAIGCAIVPTDLRLRLQKSVCAGVEVSATATTTSNPFVYVTLANPTSSIGKGWSSLADPTSGGQFTKLL